MLRAMREEVGLTLSGLAERADVSKATLSRFERGERYVSADLLARIARAIADEVHAKRGAA